MYLSILNTEHNKTVIYHLPYIGNTGIYTVDGISLVTGMNSLF